MPGATGTTTKARADMSTYILVRRLPDGEIEAHTTAFDTVGHAARAAALWLSGNRVAGSAAARLFGDALARRPIGTIWGHPAGYDFRILRADFTTDGAPITPGMRVFNYYDRWWGVVTLEQFMRESPIGPGGQYFNNWYAVARESDAYSTDLNGERLATKER